MTSRISATRARSSCSTCCSVCCGIIYGEKHVTYVRNITDVDDKINERAARDFPGLPLNEAIRKVTEKTATQFHADVAALGCLPPTFEPRATDFVLPRADGKADMVTLIRQLIARGHAYEASGEVLFDTQSMPDYGALSGRKLDEQQAGARIAVDAHKKTSDRFRAVETIVGKRTRLGKSVGQRPSGLAHRVLRHERGLSRRGVRYPWRRSRPDLPAP